MVKHLLQKLLLLVAILFVPWVTQAQTLSEYTYSTGTDATKWIDMSSATQILTPSNSDGLASSVLNIGFTFPFGEGTYTQYSVNTDGNLRLGGTVTSTGTYTTPFSSSNCNTNSPKINAFGCDGYGNSGTNYVKALNTEDANGDTLLVVEYCMGTYTTATRSELYKWQIHLYTNGNVEIVFPNAAGLPATAPAVAHQCGMCVNNTDGWIISASTNNAVSFTNGSSTTNASGTWFDANRFYRFERPVITCPRPTSLTVANVTANDFDLSWTDTSDATSWVVRINTASETVDEVLVTSTSYNVSMLQSNTQYFVFVAGICLNGDTSTWRSAEVRTGCAAISSMPYQNDFENDPSYSGVPYADAFPYCWTRINDATSTYNYYPYITTTASYVHSGNNGMYWYHTTTTTYANNEYAVLPEIDTTVYNISDLTLSFYAKTTSASYHPAPIVGVMTDPTNASTFTPVYTFSSSEVTTSWELFVVSFANFTGNGSYIAIKWPRPSSSCYLAIDDIYLTDEWCDVPTNVTASSDVNEVTVSWNTNGGNSFTVVLGNDTITNVTDSSYTFMGLPPNTPFNYSVANECTNGLSSFMGGNIRTACVFIDNLPYSYGFEDLATGSSTVRPEIPCWHHINNGTQYFGYPYVSSTTPHSGTRNLYWYGSTTMGTYADYELVVLPGIDTTLFPINTLQLTFWARPSSTSYSPVFQVGVMTDPNDVTTFQQVATINVQNVTTWQDFTTTFGAFNGYGNYIAVKLTRPSSAWYAYTDDFTIEEAPSCLPVHDLTVTSVSGESIDIAWSPTSSESEWIISDGTNEYTSYDTVFTLTGLSSSTSYTISVRAYCGGTDTSTAVTVTANTTCGDITTLPFVEDFDGVPGSTATAVSVNNLPSCWSYYNHGTRADYSGYPIVYNSTTYAYSPSNCLRFYSYYTAADSAQYAILPRTDSTSIPINTLMLTFQMRAYTTTSTYGAVAILGVMTNPADARTFIPVDTVNSNSVTTYSPFEVAFATYTGPHGHVAIKFPQASEVGLQYNYGYLDDLTLDVVPTCPKITSLSATATAAAARLDWDYSRSLGFAPESYEVAYRYTSDTFSTPVTITVYGLSHVLTGLDPDTSYTVTVTPDCGTNGTGRSMTIEFSTSALPCLESDTTGTGGNSSPAGVYLVGSTSTTSTDVMPVNGANNYSYCNHLIRASEINLPSGTTYISGVDFRFAGSAPMTNKNNCALYMCHTTMTDCNDFANPNDLVLVYEGPLNCSPTTDGWNHFEFNRGTFAYNGTGNMILAILDNSGASDANAHFYYQTLSSSTSHRVFRNDTPYSFAELGTVTAGTSVWRTNMRLTTGGTGGGNCIVTASCAPPAVHVDSVHENDVYLSWIPGYQETSWDVEYRSSRDTSWTSAAVSTSSTNITISGLTANTQYEVRVSPNCSDTLLYTTLQFRTECGATPVPFFEDFETWSTTVADPLPNCWYKKTNYSSQYPSGSTSYGHLSGKSVYVYSSNTTWSYMVLPLFAPSLDSLQMSFWLYKTNTSYAHRLFVGVMTDPTDRTTFQAVDTVAPSVASSWEEFTVSFHNYTDSGRYIAIMSPDGEYSYPYLDDLVVEYIPDCMPVVNLTVSNITGNSADITWSDTTSASSWTVEYGISDFPVGSGTILTVYDTTLTLTGLNTNTAYDVYVSPDCPSGVAGSTLVTFRTECDILTTLPYTENFDGVPGSTSTSVSVNNLPPCWTNLNHGTRSNYMGYPIVYTGSANSGSNCMRFYSFHTATDSNQYAILPLTDSTLFPVSNLMLSFQMKAYSASSGYGAVCVVGVMTDPTNDHTFIPIDTVNSNASTTYSNYEVVFSGYTGPHGHVVMLFPQPIHIGLNYNYGFVDDVILETIPACPAVHDIVLANLDSNMLAVTWTEVGTATSWDVEYGVSGFTPGSGTSAVVTSLPFTITGLTPATNYDVYVTPICSDGTAASRMETFRTANSYIGLPFNCNFEDTAQNALFALENGSNSNKWCIGSATNNGGSHALYISDNNGGSNSYTISSATLDYAYVDLMIPSPGDYGYSFDWKCYGESTLDYLRVALIPISESPVAGTALPSGLNATSMPATWISLDGNNKLNLNSSWQTRSDVIHIPSAGVYHLAFIFRCDGSVGTMPPPAVDNIMIARSPCSRPDSVSISSLTQTTADFTWSDMGTTTEWQYQLNNGTITTTYTSNAALTGLTANTNYTFRVRSVCGGGDTSFWRVYNFRTPCGYISLPYTQDFEAETTGSSTTGSAFANCWIRLNNGTSYGGYPYVSSSSTYNHTPSGTKGLYWCNSSTTGTYGDYEVVVLPPVDSTTNPNTLQLSFWAKASSASYTPVFQVGVMTDPNNVSTFVGVDTFSFSGTTWQLFEIPLNSYVGNGQFVALKADRPSSSWYAYVDDFTLDYIPTCISPRNVFASDASTNSLTVDWVDITPAMEWQVEYGPQGFTRGSAAGTSLTVYSHPILVSGLDTLASYDFYIRPVCTVGDTARWGYPVTLTTAMCDNSNTFSIGSASSSSTTYYAPVNNYYNYTLSEVIIDSAEIGGPMDIEYLGYYYDYSSPSTVKTNCTIYFQPTTLSTFSSSSDVVALNTATAVKVYTGSLNCSQGWNYFRLDSLYHFDGTTNLLIIVDDNSGDYDGSSYVFRSQPCSDNKTLYYYSDSQDPDVTTITSSYSGNKAVAAWRPVLQFVSCVGPSCRQPIITSVTKDYHSGTITWTGTGNDYEVNLKESAAPDWPATDISVSGTTHTFTGLRPSTAYTFRVRQDCSADSLGFSDWVVNGFVTDSLPCLTPDSLHATAVTNATADLDWNVNGNETNWDIHVWFSGGFDSTYRVSSRPATVGGFTAGVTYYAAIRALCGVNLVEGEWSDTVSFTTAVCPDVTGLSAGYATANSITLSWDNNPMAQSWIIEYGLSGFPQGSGITATSATNNYVVNGLTDETLYDFHVRAVCGSEWYSEGWASVTASTLSGGITCDAPTNVTATVADNSATVNWTAGQGNISFELEYGPHGFAHGSGIVTSATTSPAVIHNLDYETQYDVYVHAICDQNTVSPWSTPATFTTGQRPSEDCNPVQNLAVSNITDNSADVNWTPGDPDDSNWQIVVTDERGNDVLDTRSTETRAALSGLTPGTNYTVKVRTVCDEDNFSAFVSANFRTTGGIGIDDVSSASCSIYPNPASGSTTISVAGVNGLVKIAVVDMNGRTVASETLECSSDCVKTMDVEKLAQGAYFVRITGQDVNMVRKLIIR